MHRDHLLALERLGVAGGIAVGMCLLGGCRTGPDFVDPCIYTCMVDLKNASDQTLYVRFRTNENAIPETTAVDLPPGGVFRWPGYSILCDNPPFASISVQRTSFFEGGTYLVFGIGVPVAYDLTVADGRVVATARPGEKGH